MQAEKSNHLWNCRYWDTAVAVVHAPNYSIARLSGAVGEDSIEVAGWGTRGKGTKERHRAPRTEVGVHRLVGGDTEKEKPAKGSVKDCAG